MSYINKKIEILEELHTRAVIREDNKMATEIINELLSLYGYNDKFKKVRTNGDK